MAFESNVPINDQNVAASDAKETTSASTVVPSFWQRWKSDFFRFIPFVVIPLLLIRGDLGTIYVIAYVIALSLLFAFMTHIVRKILFPFIDLAAFAKKAFETSVGASIVFASIIGLLMVIYESTVSLMR